MRADRLHSVNPVANHRECRVVFCRADNSSTGRRLLALSEALTGFGFISLAVSYLVSLTAALERNRAVALSFYHQAREGADVAGLLIHHFVGGLPARGEPAFSAARRP